MPTVTISNKDTLWPLPVFLPTLGSKQSCIAPGNKKSIVFMRKTYTVNQACGSGSRLSCGSDPSPVGPKILHEMIYQSPFSFCKPKSKYFVWSEIYRQFQSSILGREIKDIFQIWIHIFQRDPVNFIPDPTPYSPDPTLNTVTPFVLLQFLFTW